MKNVSMIMAILVVVALGCIGVYLLTNRADYVITKSDSSAKDEKTVVTESTPMAKTDNNKEMQKNGKYVPFSPELMVSSAMTRRVLFFYANWCPTCKPANESFTANVSQLPSDLTLIRVNFNDTDTDQAEKDLAKKYGVTYQHTFVQIDAQGNAVAKWNGGQMFELLSKLK